MLRDIAAQNASLDNDYGPTRGPHTPDELEVALLETRDVATELSATTDVEGVPTGNGYARPTHSSDDWLAAADGVKTTSVPLNFGTPTLAWQTARWAALIEPVTGVVWDVVKLVEPVTVTGAGSPVLGPISVAYTGDFEG